MAFFRIRSDVTRHESDAHVAERLQKQRDFASSLDEQIRQRGRAVLADKLPHVAAIRVEEESSANNSLSQPTHTLIERVLEGSDKQLSGSPSLTDMHTFGGIRQQTTTQPQKYRRQYAIAAETEAYNNIHESCADASPQWYDSLTDSPTIEQRTSSKAAESQNWECKEGVSLNCAPAASQHTGSTSGELDVVIIHTGGAVRARPRSHVVAFGGSDAGKLAAAERRARGDAAVARAATERRARTTTHRLAVPESATQSLAGVRRDATRHLAQQQPCDNNWGVKFHDNSVTTLVDGGRSFATSKFATTSTRMQFNQLQKLSENARNVPPNIGMQYTSHDDTVQAKRNAFKSHDGTTNIQRSPEANHLARGFRGVSQSLPKLHNDSASVDIRMRNTIKNGEVEYSLSQHMDSDQLAGRSEFVPCS